MAQAPSAAVENTPEQVAHRLLKTIASNEGKTLDSSMAGAATADRKWLLSTYAQCIHVVRTGNYIDWAKPND